MKDTPPRFSIVTINLNNRAGLEKTIQSVIKQECTDYEYIIIDGGSSDGSAEVIREYQGALSYWASERDTGIYNAMNKGLKQAHGEYVCFSQFRRLFLFLSSSCRHAPEGNCSRRVLRKGNNDRGVRREGIPAVEKWHPVFHHQKLLPPGGIHENTALPQASVR